MRSVSAGLIHGDLHQENYLFCRGAVGAIDFDDCGYGHFLCQLPNRERLGLCSLLHRQVAQHIGRVPGSFLGNPVAVRVADSGDEPVYTLPAVPVSVRW